MSAIFLIVLTLGLLGAALFITGFIHGVREALRQRRQPTAEAPWVDDGRYGISAIFAVLASAAVIALVGVSPAWIYAGPLLAIVTAAGVGLAFLVGERDTAAARNDP